MLDLSSQLSASRDIANVPVLDEGAFRLGKYHDGSVLKFRGVIRDVQDPEFVVLDDTAVALLMRRCANNWSSVCRFLSLFFPTRVTGPILRTVPINPRKVMVINVKRMHVLQLRREVSALWRTS